MTLLEARDLIFTYDDGRRALDGASLSLGYGEAVGVMGRNGSGKSTLVKAIDGLIMMDSGSIKIDGIPLDSTNNIRRARRKIGISFQNVDAAFISGNVEEEILFSLRNYGIRGSDARERLELIIEEMDLEGLRYRNPRTLSGGEKQRALIASLLALEPSIMVFDEATSMLDASSKREVFALNEKLIKKGIAIIMVSHFAEDLVFTSRVVVMDEGKIIAEGSTKDILTDEELLMSHSIEMPYPAKLAIRLMKKGVQFSTIPLTPREFGRALYA